MAFWGQDAAQSQWGVYVSSGGPLQAVADTSTPIPGGTGTFTAFDLVSLDNGSVAFAAYGPPGFPGSHRGIYTNLGGTLTKVVDNTDQGFAGMTFGLGTRALSGNRIAFVAWEAYQQYLFVADMTDFCGNGVVDSGEQCDDGKRDNGDACKNDCTLNVCGDGAVNAGVEQCDDGNVLSGDGYDANCTPTGCGNGIVTIGEQCDDGDSNAGDGCSAACQSEFSPGGGLIKTDCMHEWLTAPVPSPDRNGQPKNRLDCTDDDPTCDFGTPGDKGCTFHVALRFNVLERRFACSPVDVVTAQLKRPSAIRPRDATDTANRDAVEGALGELGGLMRGRCTSAGPHYAAPCEFNSECDSAPGRGNGHCSGRFVAFTPELVTTNDCTTFADIRVPLRQSMSGRLTARRKTLMLKTLSSSAGADSDSLALTCHPHP